MKNKTFLQWVITAAIISCSFTAFSQTPDVKKYHEVWGADVRKMIKLPDGGFTILYYSRLYSVNVDGNVLWAKEIQDIDDAYFGGESFVRLSDGSYVIAGTLQGDDEDRITLIKTNAKGDLMWSKMISGKTRYDEAWDIITTGDGGFALTGNTHLIAGYPFNDPYVMKLDSSGNVLWTSVMEQPGYDYVNSIIQTSDNGYAITGESIVNNKRHLFVAKVNSNGNLLWSKYIEDEGNNNVAEKIIETKDGGLAILARQSENFYGGPFLDYFFIKLKSSGILQWAKHYGGLDEDRPTDFIQTFDGSYVITGYSSSFGNDTYTYIIKTDASGNVLLSKILDEVEYGGVISTYNSGYVIGGGRYFSDYANDGVLIKTGVNLNTCSSRNVNTVTRDGASSLNAHFLTTRRAFTVTLLSLTTIDLTISVSQLCNSLSASDVAKSSQKNKNNFAFSVYPNPAKNILHVQTNGSASFSLITQSGKILLTKNINGNEAIDVSKIAAGFYYLKNNNTGEVKKVIIER